MCVVFQAAAASLWSGVKVLTQFFFICSSKFFSVEVWMGVSGLARLQHQLGWNTFITSKAMPFLLFLQDTLTLQWTRWQRKQTGSLSCISSPQQQQLTWLFRMTPPTSTCGASVSGGDSFFQEWCVWVLWNESDRSLPHEICDCCSLTLENCHAEPTGFSLFWDQHQISAEVLE